MSRRLKFGICPTEGGRFFAEFGRLSTFHDHDLPFVNRPLVLDRFIGGESQADGVEVNWLAPINHYVSLTLGAYNKIGADNDRVDNAVPRDLSEFTYLGRVHTFFNLTDSLGLDVGASDAYTPEVRNQGLKERNLFGVDLTLRYTPLSQAAYRGFIWGTEVLVNHEGRPGITPTEDTPNQIFRFKDAWGLYSYLEARLTRRFYPGLLFEYVQVSPERADGEPMVPTRGIGEPPSGRFQRLLDGRRFRRIDGRGRSAFRVVQQHAEIILQAKEQTDIGRHLTPPPSPHGSNMH